MTTSSDGLGNIARLSGLKNVHGRKKILPGAEYLEDLEAFEPDVSGTANPSFQQQPMPEPEMGTELTPQSFDVRANRVIVPPPTQSDFIGRTRAIFNQAYATPLPKQTPMATTTQEAQPSMMSRLGQNLKSSLKSTPAAFSYKPELATQPEVPEENVPYGPETPYGLREDKTPKGYGFMGPIITNPQGKQMTEYAFGTTDVNGQEMEIPSLVPTLSPEEIDHITSGKGLTPQIEQKAVEYARQRVSEGKSPFAEVGEQQNIGQTPKMFDMGNLGKWLKEGYGELKRKGMPQWQQ